MKRSASFGLDPSKSLFALIAVAALACAPQLAFAQHSGGHVGGGGSAGGHPSGGGGGGHFSSPPPPAPHPPSAPHVTAPRPPVSNAVVRPAPVTPAGANNHSLPPSAFHGAPVGNSTGAPAGNTSAAEPQRNLTIGFPHVEAFQTVQPNSAPSATTIARPGQSLRFFGDGHQIWSEPAHRALLRAHKPALALWRRPHSADLSGLLPRMSPGLRLRTFLRRLVADCQFFLGPALAGSVSGRLSFSDRPSFLAIHFLDSDLARSGSLATASDSATSAHRTIPITAINLPTNTNPL